MRVAGTLVVAGVVAFALVQVVRPAIPAAPATAEVEAPPAVRQILDKDCYSCHSGEQRLSWFDQIVPAYWIVHHDVLTARAHLNFSTLGSKPAAAQKATLYEAVNMIRLGAMPLPRFTLLHPGAKVTPQDLATLEAYLAPWTPAPGSELSGMAAVQPPARASLAGVEPEPGGFPFAPGFEGWQPISTTDRGDNNTLRLILGNDVAVQAAQSGGISPWPDGARFAKIAWQQQPGSDGLVHPGAFVQVELMLKGAEKYKDTEGWGWGRWRGTNLKPYGADAHYVNECTGCHQPLHGNDFVYTLPISPATVGPPEILNNAAAALPAGMPYQPLSWNAITVYVDPGSHTMATLYGNDAAIQAVRAFRSAPAEAAKNVTYPAGAVLALVTWVQRDDPHWFGARIPGTFQSVEFVEIPPTGVAPGYQRYTSAGVAGNGGMGSQRTAFILGLTPAWLP